MSVYHRGIVFFAGSSLGSGLTGTTNASYHGADDTRRPEELPALPTT